MIKELIINNNPKSTISEDIRTIRTNIEFSLLEDDDKLILFTSSRPGEGKSFISSNLSVALTQNNKKVLMIDCDMRLGRLNKIFSLNNKFGLSNLLLKYKRRDDINEAIQHTKIENLDIISRGSVPPNPPELLNSKRFTDILDFLKNKYDYIILDTPPVIGLSDTIILSKIVDRIAIICSVGTKIEDLEETKKLLSNTENKIAGVILNRIKKSKIKYGYYHYYNPYKNYYYYGNKK